MLANDPEYAERLINAERAAKRTFFPPNYIPQKYHTGRDTKSGASICTVSDVARYLGQQKETIFTADDSEPRACMSYYSICE